MTSVFVKLTPTGPCLHVTSNDKRIAQLSVEMNSVGIDHELIYETDYRARLVIPIPVPMPRVRKAQEGKS